jgi:hypothetical protein
VDHAAKRRSPMLASPIGQGHAFERRAAKAGLHHKRDEPGEHASERQPVDDPLCGYDAERDVDTTLGRGEDNISPR